MIKMNQKNQIYLNDVKHAFNKKLGILSFKDFNTEYDLKDPAFFNNYNTFTIYDRYNIEDKDLLNTLMQNQCLKHFSYYMKDNNMSSKECDYFFYSFLLSIANDSFYLLLKILNDNLKSYKMIELREILSSKRFADLLYNQYTDGGVHYINNIFRYFSNYEGYNLFSQNIVNKAVEILEQNPINSSDNLCVFLNKICNEFERLNIWYYDNKKDKNIMPNNHDSNTNSNYLELNILEEAESIINNWQLKQKKTNNNNFSFNDLLNPKLDFINRTYKKYEQFLSQFENDSKSCSILKTILYISSYLNQEKELYPFKRMKNITNVDTNWAVNTEQTYNPSFYGNSKIAKAFAEYYSFMEGKRNPYNNVINNKVVNYMDEEAMKMHQYFKEQNLDDYIYNLFYEKNLIGNQSIYDFLSSIHDLIDLIESPMLIQQFEIFGLIKDLVDSILNSVAQALDFSISLSMKQLFYFKILPIGSNVLSLADVYNYASFLKLILENVNGDKSINEISKEEFANAAYQTLGIRKDYIDKIGYCAYDPELNYDNNYSLFTENLYKNSDGVNYSVKNDAKLLYSCIQFGILKAVYNTGDNDYYYNFDFSNTSEMHRIIVSLTKEEMYYLFNCYGIEMKVMENLDLNDEEAMKSFNGKLINITNRFDHKNLSFYQDFLNYESTLLNHDDVDDDYYIKEFSKSGFRNYILKLLSQYEYAIKYNESAIEKVVFQNTNVTDIDSFSMRFIPSLLEIMKVLEINNISINNITKILDYICYFLSDILFRNLFVNVKCKLIDKIKIFEEKFFANFSNDAKAVFKINIGGKSINKKIEDIIQMLETFTLNTSVISNCFNNADFNIMSSQYGLSSGENNFYLEKYKINHDLDEMEVNPADKFYKNGAKEISKEKIEKENITTNKIKKINIEKENPMLLVKPKKIKETKLNEVYKEIKNTSGNKLIYANNEIFIVKPNGEEIKVVYSNDQYIHNFKTTLHIPQHQLERELISTKSEYEALIEIRDFISNIKNSDAIFLSNSILKIDKEISKEREKNLPNFGNIKKLEEEKAKLTNSLENVKTKYNVYISDNVNKIDSSLEIEKNNSHNSDQNGDIITISNNYQGIQTAEEKKQLLENVEEVAIENNLPLTTYEIIQLLL